MKMDEDCDDNGEEDNALRVDSIRKDGASMTTDDDGEPADLDATPRIRPRRMLSPTTSQASSLRGADNHTKNKYNSSARNNSQQSAGSGGADIASLTQSLNALSLVPNSVRFGRGGKTKGFAAGDYRGGRVLIKGNSNYSANAGSEVARSIPMDVGQDELVGHGGPPGRGRGSRGRGSRARGRGN
jgi:hypothetical protein